MKFDSLDNQWKLISRGAEEIIPEEELKKKLATRKDTLRPPYQLTTELINSL